MKFFLCCHQATHPCPSRTCDTWSWCWRRQYWTSHMEGFPKWRDLQAGLAPEHCAIWKHVSRYCFLIMNTKYMCKILKYDVYSVLYIYTRIYIYTYIYIYYIYTPHTCVCLFCTNILWQIPVVFVWWSNMAMENPRLLSMIIFPFFNRHLVRGFRSQAWWSEESGRQAIKLDTVWASLAST